MTADAFGLSRETAWCPGCGNFGIREAMKQALTESGLLPRQVLFVSGIGQAAKAPHYLDCNLFNGLHGRALPAATGAKLANRGLTVIVESGDGCNYGEGGNHFLAAIRRNLDLTLVVHDNQIYGLTKGQASPTTELGVTSKAQPLGVVAAPMKPLLVAVALRAGFVARGFAGDPPGLAAIIKAAIAHPGFALVDVLQPCPSFNHLNTFAWYKQRVRPLPAGHDPTDWDAAIKLADRWGDEIPVGVISQNDRPVFEDQYDFLEGRPLIDHARDPKVLREIMDRYL